MNDEITLLVNTQRISGWKSVVVTRSIDAVAGTFDLKMVDIWLDKESAISPDMSCCIEIDKIPVITGFIDRVLFDSPANENTMSIIGRCKTADLVDCSIVRDHSEWRNKDIISIALDIVQPFGITVLDEVPGTKVKIGSVTINDGESPFELLDRLCKERAVLSIGTTRGELLFTTAGKRRASDKLIYGENVEGVSAEYDFSERFSRYIVKGQANTGGTGWGLDAEPSEDGDDYGGEGTGSTTIKITGEATDAGISRYRPKIITIGSAATTERARVKAAWEAQNRAGLSIKVSAKVAGWRQSNGDLWQENLLTYCKFPTLRVDGDLLINQISYSQDDSGTFSTMQLVRADCYAAEPPAKVKTKKKAKTWSGW